jgi:4-amino-4-deoxy-L-arabinose transferase-like glycosyltransferase
VTGVWRQLLVLLIASAALFTAGMPGLSLISVDDAFYAREGIEAGRSGQFFNLTWDDVPNFHKPPLQFWLLGHAFALFGENDFAARLPSLVMALGILAMTFRIGVLTVGPPVAVSGVALLILSPYFSDHARRVMLDVPLTFWTTLALLVFLESAVRPWLAALLAVPLAAAILTKSALGLVPLLAIVASGATVPALRPVLRTPWTWVGVAAGLGLGAAWTINQGWYFGAPALREHYLGEVGARAALAADVLGFLLGYPFFLLDSYQPVIIPAAIGAVVLWRNRAARDGLARALPICAFLPILALNFLSGRSPRYIFQVFPALALCGGFWLEAVGPGLARALRGWIAPALVAAAAITLWIAPAWLTPILQSAEDPNRDIKRGRAVLQSLIPPHERVALLGTRYWAKAAPLLYYADRRLELPAPSSEKALEVAASRPSRLLLCDRQKLGEVDARAVPYRVVFEAQDWVLIELGR